MKKLKIVIILSILICIILIIRILFLINNNREDKVTKNDIVLKEPSKETSYTMLYSIEKNLDKYVEAAVNTGDTSFIMAVLDKNYIQEFNINTSNALERINVYPRTQNKINLIINDLYYYVNSNDNAITTYFIYGKLRDNVAKVEKEFNVMFLLDTERNVYSIFPNEYMTKYGYNNINNLNNYEIKTKEISNQEYNEFEYIETSSQDKVNYYIDRFKDTLINGTIEQSYNQLDEEYRNKKFGNLDSYKKYLNENKDKLSSLEVDVYASGYIDDCEQFICIDQYDNRLLLKVKDVTDFSILLDTDTIYLDETQFDIEGETDVEIEEVDEDGMMIE